jgi:hypothetical protein
VVVAILIVVALTVSLALLNGVVASIVCRIEVFVVPTIVMDVDVQFIDALGKVDRLGE